LREFSIEARVAVALPRRGAQPIAELTDAARGPAIPNRTEIEFVDALEELVARGG
jgi:hypothetical protein